MGKEGETKWRERRTREEREGRETLLYRPGLHKPVCTQGSEDTEEVSTGNVLYTVKYLVIEVGFKCRLWKHKC